MPDSHVRHDHRIHAHVLSAVGITEVAYDLVALHKSAPHRFAFLVRSVEHLFFILYRHRNIPTRNVDKEPYVRKVRGNGIVAVLSGERYVDKHHFPMSGVHRFFQPFSAGQTIAIHVFQRIPFHKALSADNDLIVRRTLRRAVVFERSRRRLIVYAERQFSVRNNQSSRRVEREVIVIRLFFRRDHCRRYLYVVRSYKHRLHRRSVLGIYERERRRRRRSVLRPARHRCRYALNAAVIRRTLRSDGHHQFSLKNGQCSRLITERPVVACRPRRKHNAAKVDFHRPFARFFRAHSRRHASFLINKIERDRIPFAQNIFRLRRICRRVKHRFFISHRDHRRQRRHRQRARQYRIVVLVPARQRKARHSHRVRSYVLYFARLIIPVKVRKARPAETVRSDKSASVRPNGFSACTAARSIRTHSAVIYHAVCPK